MDTRAQQDFDALMHTPYAGRDSADLGGPEEGGTEIVSGPDRADAGAEAPSDTRAGESSRDYDHDRYPAREGEFEFEPRGSRLDDWWQRIMSTPVRRALWNWGSPAIVLLVAAFTRLWNLGHPHSLVFDETFYVKDAWTLWNLGYEAQWPAEADPLFNAGQTGIFHTDPSFVVHPPLGKWLIALGMAAFGPDSSVGWRISTAIIGILAVVLLMVIAKGLFKSTLLTVVAGGLFAIDGNAIVMSRVALLDNFLMFFALLGFGAMLLDRRQSAGRLALWMSQRTTSGRSANWGPALWWRPWLVAAAFAFGLASGVKWSGLYFLAAFAVYSLVVDALARRRAGVLFWGSGTLLKQAPASFLLTVPVALLTYLATWTGWFLSDNGYARRWATEPGNAAEGFFSWVPAALQSFWHFQMTVYSYHVGEERPHGYMANPLTWLFMIRPTSMYWRSSQLDENGCTTDFCGESIAGIANPIIWWAATAAILYLVYRLARFREWRVGLILMGMVAGYLPWMLYLHRTVFQFYTIAFEPYMILGLVLVVGIILGSGADPTWRRTSGLRVVGIFLGAAVLASVFFWPLWTGQMLDYNWLRLHWWLPSWR